MDEVDEAFGSTDVSDSGATEVERKLPKYPIPDAGKYNAVITKVERQENQEFGGHQILLTWEIDATFRKDNSDEDIPFTIRMYLGESFSSKSNMFQLLNDLTGLQLGDIWPVSYKERDGETYETAKPSYSDFKDMQAEVIVKHKKNKAGTKTYANIDSVYCEEGIQKENMTQCSQLKKPKATKK